MPTSHTKTLTLGLLDSAGVTPGTITAKGMELVPTGGPASSSNHVVVKLETASNIVHVIPFVKGASNDATMDFVLFGYQGFASGGGRVYVPTVLGEFQATINSSLQGLADVTPNGTGDLFADAISKTAGVAAADIGQSTGRGYASVYVDHRGSDYLGVQFGTPSAGSAFVANALVGTI